MQLTFRFFSYHEEQTLNMLPYYEHFLLQSTIIYHNIKNINIHIKKCLIGIEWELP